jgi:hypothetical protein
MWKLNSNIFLLRAILGTHAPNFLNTKIKRFQGLSLQGNIFFTCIFFLRLYIWKNRASFLNLATNFRNRIIDKFFSGCLSKRKKFLYLLFYTTYLLGKGGWDGRTYKWGLAIIYRYLEKYLRHLLLLKTYVYTNM